MNPGTLDLVGNRYDKLIVMEMLERTKSGKLWLCRCDCGASVVKLTTQLRRMTRASRTGCRGCERKSRSDANTRHAGCKYGKSRLYNTWRGMRSRCADNKNRYYGGKGVRVCDEWSSFPAFRAWANSTGYKDHLTIDRINSLGNYHPANCEWVTKSENSKRMAEFRWANTAPAAMARARD